MMHAHRAIGKVLYEILQKHSISMEQSTSWEAISRSASQEISRLLWNPQFNFRVHKLLLLTEEEILL